MGRNSGPSQQPALACQACEDSSQTWVLQPPSSLQMTTALADIFTAASSGTLSRNWLPMFNVLSSEFWGNSEQQIGNKTILNKYWPEKGVTPLAKSVSVWMSPALN